MGTQRVRELASLAKERIEIRGQSYVERESSLASVMEALRATGCSLVQPPATSAMQTEIQFYLQLRSAEELYAALIASGLEMPRESHLVLTSLCTVRRYNPRSVRHRRVVTVRLEVRFVEQTEFDGAVGLVGLA